MNLKRIFLGGLVAGVTFLLITGIVSGVFLKLEMENWMLTMKEVLHPPAPSIALVLWATMCFLYGQAESGFMPLCALVLGLDPEQQFSLVSQSGSLVNSWSPLILFPRGSCLFAF